jgi:hypothetical protein
MIGLRQRLVLVLVPFESRRMQGRRTGVAETTTHGRRGGRARLSAPALPTRCRTATAKQKTKQKNGQRPMKKSRHVRASSPPANAVGETNVTPEQANGAEAAAEPSPGRGGFCDASTGLGNQWVRERPLLFSKKLTEMTSSEETTHKNKDAKTTECYAMKRGGVEVRARIVFVYHCFLSLRSSSRGLSLSCG